MNFGRTSDIEQRRIMRFGRKSKLLFSKEDTDNGGLTYLGEIETHFDMIRDNNTETGEVEVQLIFLEIEGNDYDYLGDILYIDLVWDRDDPTLFDRFLLKTETPPVSLERVWFLNVTPEISNKMEVQNTP